MTSSSEPAATTQHHERRNHPPPLPPRALSTTSDAPPPYSVMAMSSHDPRSSSTQSLVPDPELENTGRRRLLLVYIHGFMGNETSFRSFPAHVHNLVTITLADSHVVHTKIYPRYQSRNALEVARDDFSRWLAPHEDQWTDVILLGHSMGGLLAADIALVFRHSIIGIVNFDVPFLGMHPGIVKAGLGSIFSPSPPPQDATVAELDAGKKPSRIGTLFNPKPTDPNYNPAFPNDVQLPVRKGWENSLHWLSKHYQDGLRQATKGLLKSHFEFGGAMADYRELKDRYAKVRALEEDDERKRASSYPQMRSVPRVRFINYYTASTGKPKKPKSPKSPSRKSPSPSSSRPSSRHSQHRDGEPSQVIASQSISDETQYHDSDGHSSVSSLSQPDMIHIHPEPIAATPRVSIEVQEYREGEIVSVGPEEALSTTSPVYSTSSHNMIDRTTSAPTLPEIPPIPQEPPFVDLMQFSDKSQRKAAEKEHNQALKVYQKAVKARNKAINERTKLEEKWEKLEKEKREKLEKEKREKLEKEKREKLEKEKREKQESEDKEKQKANQAPVEKDLRQVEREQRQAEADQRQAEAKQRELEAEQRQSGSNKPQEQAKSPSAPTTLEEDLSAVQLGDHDPHHSDSHTTYSNYDFSRSVIMSQAPPDDRASVTDSGHTLSTVNSRTSHHTTSQSEKPPKPKKLGKFCMLPPKDAAGNKDPTWVRVLMEGMDEVTAHTSLFFVNDTYERLVGDVGARIEDWVREADSVRLVREIQEMN